MKFNLADLVKWYEYYACGTIVKDAGTGMICECHALNGTHQYHVFTGDGIKIFSQQDLDSYE